MSHDKPTPVGGRLMTPFTGSNELSMHQKHPPAKIAWRSAP